MSLTDEKYIVFKQKQFLEWFNGKWPPTCDHGPGQLDIVTDAVVIRTQDVFSGPALASYANSIAVAMDVLTMGAYVPPELLKELRQVADYFHQRSEEAFQRSDQKLPD